MKTRKRTKETSIKQLYNQRKNAINSLDFEGAKKIDLQIRKIREKKEKVDFSQVRIIQQRKKALKQKSVAEFHNYFDCSKQLADNYNFVLNELKKRQRGERRQLREERKKALDREIERPIPAARERLMKAIVIAKMRNYDEAEKLKQEALEITQRELPVRLEQCKNTYKMLGEKMKARHLKERESLSRKFQNDYGQMTFKTLKTQTQLLASMQFKNVMEKEKYTAAIRKQNQVH